MFNGDFDWPKLIVNLVYAALLAALFLSFRRLARGPSLPDRVVAADLITSLTVGLICTYAIATSQHVFLDVAIVLALIGFLSTVAFAIYIQRRAQNG